MEVDSTSEWVEVDSVSNWLSVLVESYDTGIEAGAEWLEDCVEASSASDWLEEYEEEVELRRVSDSPEAGPDTETTLVDADSSLEKEASRVVDERLLVASDEAWVEVASTADWVVYSSFEDRVVRDSDSDEALLEDELSSDVAWVEVDSISDWLVKTSLEDWVERDCASTDVGLYSDEAWVEEDSSEDSEERDWD